MTADAKSQARFSGIIEDTIARHRMIVPKDHLLAAVSGGPDSVALVLSLLELAPNLNFTLGIAHVNHCLRGVDADEDEAFVRRLAKDLNLTFHNTAVDVKKQAGQQKISLEEAGRHVRYAFFKELCDRHGYTKIATGHTKDDNAELVLMNLLRGSGLKGLTGIPPIRDSKVIRPLIRVTKLEIFDFLKTRGQSFRQDDSNFDPAFLRNRVRRDLLPRLQKEYNPSINDALDRLSRILRQEDDYLATKTHDALKTCRCTSKETFITLDIKTLNNFHAAIRARVVRQAILQIKADLKRIHMGHLQDILELCVQKSGFKSLDLPGQIRVYKSGGTLTVKKEELPLRLLGQQEKDKSLKIVKDTPSKD